MDLTGDEWRALGIGVRSAFAYKLAEKVADRLGEAVCDRVARKEKSASEA